MTLPAGAGPGLLALARSGIVIAGLLLLAVGVGDTVAGRLKITQYEELLRTTPVPPPADPAALFATASEGQERRDLARTKLAFYHLLLNAGQLLSAVGFGLIALGIVRVRMRAAGRGDMPATN
jgi:uncharacterized membrane protein